MRARDRRFGVCEVGFSNNTSGYGSDDGRTENLGAQEQGEKKGIFEDFSFAAVIASGLAAATSFALASQIGIAGSIIGTLIGGFATAATSQVYKSLLSASAEKIRQASPADADATVADATRRIDRNRFVARADIDEVAESGTPIAPPEIREAARAAEHRRTRRRATIVPAAVALVAVLVFALVVSFVTQGAGIGTKPAPAQQEQVVSDKPAQGSESSATGKGEASGKGAQTQSKAEGSGKDSSGSSSQKKDGETGDGSPSSTTSGTDSSSSGTSSDGANGSTGANGAGNGSDSKHDADSGNSGSNGSGGYGNAGNGTSSDTGSGNGSSTTGGTSSSTGETGSTGSATESRK